MSRLLGWFAHVNKLVLVLKYEYLIKDSICTHIWDMRNVLCVVCIFFCWSGIEYALDINV